MHYSHYMVWLVICVLLINFLIQVKGHESCVCWVQHLVSNKSLVLKFIYITRKHCIYFITMCCIVHDTIYVTHGDTLPNVIYWFRNFNLCHIAYYMIDVCFIMLCSIYVLSRFYYTNTLGSQFYQIKFYWFIKMFMSMLSILLCYVLPGSWSIHVLFIGLCCIHVLFRFMFYSCSILVFVIFMFYLYLCSIHVLFRFQ